MNGFNDCPPCSCTPNLGQNFDGIIWAEIVCANHSPEYRISVIVVIPSASSTNRLEMTLRIDEYKPVPQRMGYIKPVSVYQYASSANETPTLCRTSRIMRLLSSFSWFSHYASLFVTIPKHVRLTSRLSNRYRPYEPSFPLCKHKFPF
jgi:hypothetical protein